MKVDGPVKNMQSASAQSEVLRETPVSYIQMQLIYVKS